MWSMQPLPFLNPACSRRSFFSTASVILDTKNMQKTLLGMVSKVIPLKFLQLVKSPDFGILMMLPSDQLNAELFKINSVLAADTPSIP